jgi:hypothetical protein
MPPNSFTSVDYLPLALTGHSAPLAAKTATSTIPIVFSVIGDRCLC